MRVGFGYDAHPLVAGRPLVLAGVSIPFDRGLDGYSDADVAIPGRPFGFATLQVRFDFGGKSVADISARVENTSVSVSTSGVDGYFVRPADAAHVPGSACTPP